MPGLLSKLEQIAVPAGICVKLDLVLLIGPDVHRLGVPSEPTFVDGLAKLALRHPRRWLNHSVDVPAPAFVFLHDVDHAQAFAVSAIGVAVCASIEPLHEAPELFRADFRREPEQPAVSFNSLLQCEGDRNS